MNFKTTTIALAVLLACQTSHAQSNKQMAAQLQQMQEQLQSLRAELDALKKQKAAEAPAQTAQPATAATPQRAAQSAAPATPAAAAATTGMPSYGEHTAAARVPQDSPISFFGYGEMSFTRPRHDPASSVATVGRAVLGIGYRFNERTRLMSELEVENAVVSKDDDGEVAVEQLYIEHDLRDNLSAKLGLFLMPFGYMNETHEPTRYYGVHRNFVETAIIPSTWREMGVGLRGTTDEGLRWDAGVVTSFDMNKWPTTGDGSADTLESPLGAIHQEGQNAKAASTGYYGALNYNGIPGFNVGGAVFHGGVGHRQQIPSASASVTLSEVHARWQPGAWDLSSVAAFGRFHNVADYNAGPSVGNPLPGQFRGWYAQAVGRLWKQGDYSLSPFARYERFNTALGFPGVPQGTVIDNDLPDVRVWTVGANFYLHPQVVLKADYQRFLSDSSRDRYNLGIGFHY